MSYNDGNYNGVVYLGAVKWSNDGKHQMLFTNSQGVRSAQARHDFLISNLTKINGNISAVTSPNNYIDIDCIVKDVEKVNYCYYKNDNDFSNTYFCCFVTSYEIISEKTTRLFLQWDYFQQFFYSTYIYQCYIERTIIPKNLDSASYNTLPEPISVTLEDEHKIKDIFTSDKWEPFWVLHSSSYYDNGKYVYEGVGGSSNSYGEYSIPIRGVSEIRNLLKQYGRKSAKEIWEDVSGSSSGNVEYNQWIDTIFSVVSPPIEILYKILCTTSIADMQDHRNELIGLYAIPKWLSDLAGSATVYNNNRLSDGETISLNNSTLANGYTPRNKKLLSSVCRGYILANKNGLKIPLKPELFTANSTTLTLTGIATATSGYQYELSNYNDKLKSYGEIPYSSERRVGYDQNTGINKALNLLGAGSQIAASAGAIAGGIATTNPVTALSGAGSVIGAGIKAIDSLGSQEGHLGNNGDLLRVTGGRSQLSFYEINPLYNECQAIDNFFDMYGYTINKHGTINLYARSKWNYFKTTDFNCYVEAPAEAENAIKDMFNNGITLWLDYDHFGDYSQTNS